MADYTTDEQAAIVGLGQVNKNRYDATANPSGLAGIGYKTLIALISNWIALVCAAIKRQADAAKTAADQAISVAVNAPTTASTTSVTIVSSGTVTFACSTSLQTTSPFRPGMWVKAVDQANPTTKWVWGQIPAAGVNTVTNALSLALSKSAGSGAVANWYIQATGPDGPASGIANLQADTAPKLGGDLHSNGSDLLMDSGDAVIFDAGALGLSMNGTKIDQALLGNYAEAISQLGSGSPKSVSNTVTLPRNDANRRFATLGGNTIFVLPSGSVAANTMYGFTLQVTQAASGTAFSHAFQPAAGHTITYANGSPVLLGLGQRAEYVIERKGGSTEWIVSIRYTGI